MKAWLRWGSLIGGALLALVLIAAGALAYLVYRLDIRAEVERAVEGATGRELTIIGDVGVSYWPVLGLHAAEASLANVEGGRAPAFMSAADIHVGVELAPLLSRQVVVRQMVLQQPRIALEVDAQGRPNWILAPAPREGPAPSTRPSAPAINVTLRELRIDGGEVSFIDARRGTGWVVGEVDLRTALTNLDAPMRVAGSVRYNDQPIDVVAEIARPGAVIRGQATALKLDLDSVPLVAHFDGQTAASGELAGVVRASGPSLRQLAGWTGAPLQGSGGLANFEVTGHIAAGAGRFDFTNAALAIDGIRGRGDFSLSELRGKPYLSGRLELSEFDLNAYIASPAAAPSSEAEPVPPRAIDVQTAPLAAPIDWAGLRAFNADLELVTAAVLVQRMRIDAARASVIINDGYLAATLHELSLYGGAGRGHFEIDARQADARIAQELSFSGLDARAFLTDAINFSNIEGRAELSLNLRAQGQTQSAMIAGADGVLHLEVVSGTLHGVDLGGVSRTIRNALRGELIAPQASTPFQGFSANFAVSDGVLASHDLSFNTPDLRIPGIGIIDLPQRRLDLRLAPRSPRGGLVFPFSIRGPWGQFDYAADISDRARRDIAARVAAVETAARAN